MPVLRKYSSQKFVCTQCRWTIVKPGYYCGDCIGIFEMVQMRDVSCCPKCGCTKIEKVELSAFDKLNPFVVRKWKHYLKNNHKY